MLSFLTNGTSNTAPPCGQLGGFSPIIPGASLFAKISNFSFLGLPTGLLGLSSAAGVLRGRPTGRLSFGVVLASLRCFARAGEGVLRGRPTGRFSLGVAFASLRGFARAGEGVLGVVSWWSQQAQLLRRVLFRGE